MLEKACCQHVGLLWLTGLHYPDHNTLWRFYRDNRRALKGVLVQGVRLAVKGGLVGMALNAVDNSYEVLVDTTIVEKKDSSGSEFEIWDFRYDREADMWICPEGGVLRFERKKKHGRKGYGVRVYRCQGFEGCVHRWKCSKNKKGRTIGVSPYHFAIVNQLEKQKQVKNKALLKRKKTIVDPVFGIIKQGLNFRRWTVRGVENVRAQWFLICSAINRREIYLRWKCVSG